ncbi:MAG: hypothetical protein RBS99_11780 [Rhodospirillales bacterium]|jgi:uncharacterized protein YjiS (DUF1127 family)|nr:hypothetical protein [Rhodospirillales bacterium]
MERNRIGPDYLDRADRYTLVDVLRIEQEAARLQAEVSGAFVGKVVGGVGYALRNVASGVARGLRDHWAGLAAGRLNTELARFSDHQLARLGIDRSDIPSYVAGLVETPLMGDRPTIDSVGRTIIGSGIADEPAANEESIRRRAA